MAADQIDNNFAFQNGAETCPQFKAFFEVGIESI